MLIWVLSAVAGATMPLLCGTSQHASEFLSHRPRSPSPPVPVPTLFDHESHGEIPNVLYSEQFALKWGPDHTMSDEHASAILTHFEDIHTAEVDDWSMASPIDGVRYFNVYVGDTGGVIPSAGGMAGYYTTDSDHKPMIVLGLDTVADLTYARSVIAHEYFHAVQWASESFWTWETGSWFWEATATWAAGEVVPDQDSYWNFLPFYALKPQVGLYHDTMDAFGGAPPDLHQYGAFIFARYISEVLDRPETILSAWRDGGTDEDPVAWLRIHMTDEVFGDALVGHAARNLTWEYADGERWSDWVDEVASWHPEQDDRIAPLIAHSDEGWYTVSSEDTPAAGGYNLAPIPLDVVDGEELIVAVRADVEEGLASASKFRARVVSILDGEPTTHIVDPAAPHTVITVDPAAELWLVVAKIALIADFPMNYKVAFFPQPDFPEEDEPVEDTGVPPIDDTGEAPEDTGEAAPEDPEDPPPSADSDDADTTTELDPPPAYDDNPSETESKSGCSYIDNRQYIPTWLLFLVPALLVRRRNR